MLILELRHVAFSLAVALSSGSKQLVCSSKGEKDGDSVGCERIGGSWRCQDEARSNAADQLGDALCSANHVAEFHL